MPVITFTSLKGGSGKTTSVIYTATAAARAGREVVIADTDPDLSIVEWVEGLDTPFDVVPVVGGAIADKIRRHDTDDKLIVVDTPPGSDAQAIAAGAVTAADLAITPCAPNGVDVHRLSKSIELAEAVGTPTAVLLVRTDERWRGHKDLVTVLDSNDDVIRFPTVIPDRRAIADAFATIPTDLHGYDEVWASIATTLEALT